MESKHNNSSDTNIDNDLTQMKEKEIEEKLINLVNSFFGEGS